MKAATEAGCRIPDDISFIGIDDIVLISYCLPTLITMHINNAGMGVHKYLLKLKIKAAMELLADGDGVAVVAEKVGFGSQSYFSKAFKRETGQNPTDFKM